MKIQCALFVCDFFEDGRVKFRAGQSYPLNAETLSRIKAGDAEKNQVKVNVLFHAVQTFIANRRLARDRADTITAERQAGVR
jgi:hypothetical protein